MKEHSRLKDRIRFWSLRVVALFLIYITRLGKGAWWVVSRISMFLQWIFGRHAFRFGLVPLYKGVRLIGKYLHPALRPYSRSIWSFLFNRYTIHGSVGIIIALTVVSNLSAQEVRADEFGRKSILFYLLPHETDSPSDVVTEEVITKDDIQGAPLAGQSERYSDYFSAVSTTPELGSSSGIAFPVSSTLAVIEAGSALVKPTNVLDPEDLDQSDHPFRTEITSYTVREGDTISTIALDFGISINTLLWENGLTSRSIIRPGDALAILPFSGVSYTVRSGDTLLALANRYDVTVKDILDANGLTPESTLSIGQKLVLPGAEPYKTTPVRPRQNVPSPIATITDIFRKAPSIPLGDQLVWPTPSRKINQYFKGWRHTGIDIHGTLEHDIYAALGGEVVSSGWNSGGYGYWVVIDHGNGMKTLYAHASKLFVQAGQHVEKGQALGKVGSTGRSTGPHLHFEIIVDGARQNPLSYY